MIQWLLALFVLIAAHCKVPAPKRPPRVYDFSDDIIEGDLIHPEGIID